MKVSICIPAYKQVKFLRATLQSVAIQDFDDYELIVSDDSPDDSVRELLAEFDFGERLTYVRNAPALGSPENWNACIRLARGELVKILHHDDHFTRPDSLRRFVALLDDHPEADFGFAATRVEDVNSGLERIHRPSEEQLNDLRCDPATLFLGNSIGAPSATICRRGMALDYDRRMKWLVDLDYYFRALMRNPRFAYCAEPLIGTPTNAAHQVTEICRDDAVIELGEAILLFAKFTPAQKNLPQVRRGWRILCRRYKLRKVQDFGRFGLPEPADAAYFDTLLRTPLRAWLSLGPWRALRRPDQLALKVFYRLYPHVPAFIRRPIKLIVLRARARNDRQ
ncbi:MAG TPA: glycosyltransferase [Ramlibacter sp.]|nr:glycosyltransferase [Ramlibacter sp.]